MRKNKTAVQHHVFMTKFLHIEQHLSQLTLNICCKCIKNLSYLSILYMYVLIKYPKQQLYILGFYWFCNICIRCNTPALPFALIAMIRITFFQRTQGEKMQTSYCYQPKLVCFHMSLTF